MAAMVAILDFGSKRFFATFDLHAVTILPTRFRVSWPFGSGEAAQTRFSRWQTWLLSWICYPTILSILDLQVVLILPNKF